MERIIFTNGCFDILHRGHIELFKYAKSLGDKLVVGIDSDKKVQQDKGQTRPFNCLEDRMIMLNAIKYIDEVVLFNTQQELKDLVKAFNPNVLVVGSDWKGKEVVGDVFAKEVKFFDRIAGYSTTKILENNK